MLRSFTGYIVGPSLSDSFYISLRRNSTAAKPKGVPLATEWDGIDLLAVKQAPFASALAKSRPTAQKGLNQLFLNNRQNKVTTSTTSTAARTQNFAKPRQTSRIVATEASRERPLNKASNANQQDGRVNRPISNLSSEVSRQQRPASGPQIYNRPTSTPTVPSTVRIGTNRALAQNENQPQRSLSQVIEERKNAAKWNRMTREREAIGAAFIARPITIRNIPKFDALHPEEKNADNRDNRRQMFPTPRTSQGQRQRERRFGDKDRIPGRPSAKVTAKIIPTLHVTPLTDFDKLFHQSPYTDGATSESEEKKQGSNIPPDIRVVSYESYRDIPWGTIHSQNILNSARLLMSKQRDLGLPSRKKTLGIVEKFLRSESKLPSVTA